MNSQKIGSKFELLALEFFTFFFEKLGFIVLKARPQKSGTQNGFDLLFEISKDFQARKIYIECKNYKTDLDIGNIFKKALNLDSSITLGPRDMFIAINPSSKFKNSDIEEFLSPSFDRTFPFKSGFIDANNGVDHLFALNRELYRELYGKEVDFDLDEAKTIDKFKEWIFSRRPFKLITLSETNRESFIGNLEIVENYISRTFSEEPNMLRYFLLDDDDSRILSDIITTENKVFILGNPGTGKSTELKKLAQDLFKIGEQQGLVPIFRNLRDFTSSDNIADFLNLDIDDLDGLLFILDGIDEIADIEYFKSKLTQFIENNKRQEKDFKYVVSCRTNIYESLVRDFKEFIPFYLNNLTDSEIFGLLRSNCGDIIDSLDFNDNIREFLNNPFQIKILSEYINGHGKTPKTTHGLWSSYIEKRLSEDKDEKLRKIKLVPAIIKKHSKKMSIINELMKTNVMNDEDIFSMTGGDSKSYEEFLKSPLLNVQGNSPNRSFEHRNIQEYFAATILASRDADAIIEFIQVGDTGKTHPSLFNTITFLLSLLPEDSKKHKKLITWFLKNEYELLFRADGNRLNNDTRIEVFQRYFKTSCIDNTLWITTIKTFDVKEIASFGNIPENYHYLLDIIKTGGVHDRALISALDLLSHIDVPDSERQNLKTFLIDSFGNEEISKPVKAYMISLIEQQKLGEADAEYFREIFKIFKHETTRQINRRLLSLLEHKENVDDFFEYILTEFLRANNLTERIDDDNVRRANDRAVEVLILKLKSKEYLLQIVKYYFDEGNRLKLDGMFASALHDKLTNLIANEKGFVAKFIELVHKVFSFRLHDRFLEKLIADTKIEVQVTKYLLSTIAFADIRYFLADITTPDSLSYLETFLTKSKIDDQEVEKFRNTVGNIADRKLAVSFHKNMEKIKTLA